MTHTFELITEHWRHIISMVPLLIGIFFAFKALRNLSPAPAIWASLLLLTASILEWVFIGVSSLAVGTCFYSLLYFFYFMYRTIEKEFHFGNDDGAGPAF